MEPKDLMNLSVEELGKEKMRIENEIASLEDWMKYYQDNKHRFMEDYNDLVRVIKEDQEEVARIEDKIKYDNLTKKIKHSASLWLSSIKENGFKVRDFLMSSVLLGAVGLTVTSFLAHPYLTIIAGATLIITADSVAIFTSGESDKTDEALDELHTEIAHFENEMRGNFKAQGEFSQCMRETGDEIEERKTYLASINKRIDVLTEGTTREEEKKEVSLHEGKVYTK